jgi:phage FluMu protein gp41
MQQDYFQRQIDQLGKVFAQLFSKMMGSKNTNDASLQLAHINSLFKQELGLDLNQIRQLSSEDFNQLIQDSSKFSTDTLVVFADLLFHLATPSFNDEEHRVWSEEALFVFQLIEKQSLTFSQERNLKMSQLKNLLED